MINTIHRWVVRYLEGQVTNHYRVIKRTEHQLGTQAETVYMCENDPEFRSTMGRVCRIARKNQNKMRSQLRRAERKHKNASFWMTTLTGGDA